MEIPAQLLPAMKVIYGKNRVNMQAERPSVIARLSD